MKIGDKYEADGYIGNFHLQYEVVEVCSIKEWCTVLMQKIDDRDMYGVLDYSFETDSIYDFVEDLDILDAIELFIDRMPVYKTW